jgi:murein DD-endopeptidase MepM/ murein hydrolase activator NlpD
MASTTRPWTPITCRVVPARVLPGVVFLLAALVLLGPAAAAPEPPRASARAFAVQVVIPAGNGTTAAYVVAPPQAAASLPGYSWGNGVVTTGALATGARTTAGSASAESVAAASLESVALFGGEITIASVELKSVARASGTGAGGRFAASALTGVTVLGAAVAPAVNKRVPLGDWGYAVLLEQAVSGQSGTRLSKRLSARGVHVVLTADHGGLPAGTEIVVGYADAAASAPKAVASPPAQPPTPPPPGPPKDPLPPPPGAPPAAPPPIVQNPPAQVQPQLTQKGYVFPVYGPASFSDDFRAGRATTGWHHGNDIFAPFGAPILAVTDGELFLVGWNTIGGNRLWLRDAEGNEFYYAHLSAFSPLARDGARVRAGDVIGFVGNSGDAQGTPPHLHFEVHPVGLLWLGYDGVVNPFPYLLAWGRLLDVSFDAAWAPPPGKARPAGAVLLLSEDIATESGLDWTGIRDLVAMPELFGEGPPGPKVVTATPSIPRG